MTLQKFLAQGIEAARIINGKQSGVSGVFTNGQSGSSSGGSNSGQSSSGSGGGGEVLREQGTQAAISCLELSCRPFN